MKNTRSELADVASVREYFLASFNSLGYFACHRNADKIVSSVRISDESSRVNNSSLSYVRYSGTISKGIISIARHGIPACQFSSGGTCMHFMYRVGRKSLPTKINKFIFINTLNTYVNTFKYICIYLYMFIN